MSPRIYLEKLMLILTIILSCSHKASAQESTNPNAWIAGGGFSFNVQQNEAPTVLYNFTGNLTFIYGSASDDSRNINFRFAPYIGKEVSPHWVVGVQAECGLGRFKADDVVYTVFPGQNDTVDIKRNANEYGIGLFGRYMFNPDNQFVFYIQPGINYFFTNRVELLNDVEDDRIETSSFEVGASLGALYELSEKFRLTARLGGLGFVVGHWKNAENGDKNNFSNFSTSVNLSAIFFGFEARF